MRGQAEARAVPGVEELTITAEPGDELVPLPEGTRYLGFLLARGTTPEVVEQSLRDAHRRLTVVISAAPPTATRRRHPRDPEPSASNRMLKNSASFVLASFRPSTYPEGTTRPFTRCGLAGQPFEHPAGAFSSCAARGGQRSSSSAEMVFPHHAECQASAGLGVCIARLLPNLCGHVARPLVKTLTPCRHGPEGRSYRVHPSTLHDLNHRPSHPS